MFARTSVSNATFLFEHNILHQTTINSIKREHFVNVLFKDGDLLKKSRKI